MIILKNIFTNFLSSIIKFKQFKFIFPIVSVLLILITNNYSYSANIDRLIDSLRNEAKIPGMGFIGISDNKVSLLGSCGVKCIDTQEPVTIDSPFHLGSNTKALTSVIAMKLNSEGKLKLDDKFFDYFPDLKPLTNRSYDSVTLELLLTHRAGIAPMTSGSDLKKAGDLPADKKAAEELIARYLFSLPPEVPQGLPFVYSNAGYMLASMMLEKASGLSYKELIHKYIELPLGIKCGFGWPTNSDSSATCGHIGKSWGKDTLKPFRDSSAYSLPVSHLAAGDAFMSIKDYSKFLLELIKSYKGKSKFLTEKEAEILFFDRKIYALGWLNASIDGIDIVTHDGSAGTFYCHAWLIPDRGIAAALMFNSAEDAVQPASVTMREAIIKHLTGNQ